MLNSCPAIVLKTSPYSRTSQIVTWLTPAGRATTLVKGALRPKSASLGQYDLFYTCEILYYAARHGGLSVLRECSPVNSRTRLRSDWRACASASYVCDIVARLTREADETLRLFALTETFLDYVCASSVSVQILIWFELQLLDTMGFSPRTAACASCGTAFGPAGKRGMIVPSVFSHSAGGLICSECGGPGYPLPRPLAAMLRQWQSSSSPNAAANTVCADKQLLDFQRLLDIFIRYHMEPAPVSRNIVFDMLLKDRTRSSTKTRKEAK